MEGEGRTEEKKAPTPRKCLDEGEGRGAIRWQERRCSDCPMWFSVLRPHDYLRTHSVQALRQHSSTSLHPQPILQKRPRTY